MVTMRLLLLLGAVLLAGRTRALELASVDVQMVIDANVATTTVTVVVSNTMNCTDSVTYPFEVPLEAKLADLSLTLSNGCRYQRAGRPIGQPTTARRGGGGGRAAPPPPPPPAASNWMGKSVQNSMLSESSKFLSPGLVVVVGSS